MDYRYPDCINLMAIGIRLADSVHTVSPSYKEDILHPSAPPEFIGGEGLEIDLQQAQLDIIVDVAEAYTNILQAQSNLRVQQKNVEVTKENYNISKSKNAIGYEGASDLYRWDAELATKNIDLNNAYAVVQQAKFRLNQLLNRPIDEPFSVQDETLERQMLVITDDRMKLISD